MTLDALLTLAVVGLMFGSFFNVCIARIPAGESVASPPSRCPTCKTAIKWYDNIPVVSWLLLGGRCRACRSRISVRYPIVEVVTAVAFTLQGLTYGEDPVLLASRLVLTSALIVLFGTDLDVQRLPNVITLPGIALGIVFSLWTPPGLIAVVVGAALGAGLLLAVRWGWHRATGVEAMGLGDVKMLAMIGAFLGWRQVFVTLFLASIAGALIGISLAVVRGRSMQSRLPFGTFLALAAYVASITGEPLLQWYLGMME